MRAFGALGVAAAALALLPTCARPRACGPEASRLVEEPYACAEAGCPRSAIGDAAGGCRCVRGTVPLLGACVAPSTLDAFCGPDARAAVDTGACVARACPAPQPLDVDTGACVPLLGVRAAAAASQRHVGEDETLACRRGVRWRAPILDHGKLVCLPDDAGCARGATWRAGKCVSEWTCGPGEVRDGRTCRRVIRPGARPPAPYVVDAAAWARAALGPDGGAGSAALCGALTHHPIALGVDAGAEATLAVTVELVFPDNDPTEARAQVTATERASGRRLPPGATEVVERAVRPLVEALRALGGETSAASLRTTVACAVRAEAPPSATPLEQP